MLQKQKDGRWKPVHYASQAFSAVEERYSQLEKEALAVLIGLRKMRIYVLGKQVELLTDHEPLVKIFSQDCCSTAPNLRIAKMVDRCQDYCYDIKHIAGSINIADVWLRLRCSSDDNHVAVDFIEAHAINVAESFGCLSLLKLAQQTKLDLDL